MAKLKILTIIFAATLSVECIHQKRQSIETICDPTHINTIQCFCIRDHRNENLVRSAECHLTKNGTYFNDTAWDAFRNIHRLEQLTLSDLRGVSLKYIPTMALKHVPGLVDINIKYAEIKEIGPFAFNNLTHLNEIILNDAQIEVLHKHAFYHLRRLTKITLDKNGITEINRDVFVELPLLEELFLTNNNVTTIHDRAFVHLMHLRVLELDKNKIFSLNSETFSGLKNLHRLDLGENSLEVIGDNTFLPLVNLETLNLQDNKIQMLDEKAFSGLIKLRSLSLERNKLTVLDNVKIFESLNSLVSLKIRANKITKLNEEVLKPILGNFYNKSTSLDFDDNEFPCDCKLDWLLILRNKTKNSRLQLSIENLKCVPSDALMAKWKSQAEADKNNAALDEEGPAPNTDYEYYDDSQLNGQLFYVDIRDMLNCTTKIYFAPNSDIQPQIPSNSPTAFTLTNSPKTTEPKITTIPSETQNVNKKDNKNAQSTTQSVQVHFPMMINVDDKIENDEKQKFTTTRLATVSAKPTENLINEEDGMASDEGLPPDAHRHQRYSHDTEVNSSGMIIFKETALIIPILTIFYRLV